MNTETLTPQHTSFSSKLYRNANFIANKWVETGDGSQNVVFDKYTGAELASLPNATEEQMESAIQSATEAFSSFKLWSAGKRSATLDNLADLITEHQDELAALIVHEGGKPISYAKNEIDRCITTVKTAAAEALRFGGETVPLDFALVRAKSLSRQDIQSGPLRV